MSAWPTSTTTGRRSRTTWSRTARFPPSEAFKADTLVASPFLYDEADEDYQGFWAEQAAELLDWDEEWHTILEWELPFAKWFVGGKLNVCHNAVDRHVLAGPGRQGGVPLGGRARRHPHHHLRRPPPRGAALRQRAEGPRRRQGRPRLHLHADDPRAPGRDAGLRPHRRAALGRVRRLQPRLADRPHQRRRVQGRDHRRRRLPPRRAVPAQAERRRRARRPRRRSSTWSSCGGSTSPSRWSTGRDHWWHDLMAAADPECPCESMDSEDLLYLLYTSGTTAKPKGIMHTTGGYLTQVAFTHKYVFDLHPDTDVYWCAADIGWVTGHSYIVYGPLTNGATSVMYEGTPDTPGKDRLWDIAERYGVTILYTAPTAIRTFMKWGAQEPERHDLSKLRLLGSVGEPINPEAWMWYHEHIGGGRCPIVDTWWQTETGAIMISPLPGRHHHQAGLGHLPAAGHRRRGRRRRRRARRARRRLPHAHPPVAVDAARHLRRPGALPGDLLESLRGSLLRGRRLQARRRRLPVAARSGRRRDERVRPPHLHHRGRVGARRPPGRGRGGRGRRQRRRHRSGDHGLRDRPRERHGRRPSSARRSASTWPRSSGPSPARRR